MAATSEFEKAVKGAEKDIRAAQADGMKVAEFTELWRKHTAVLGHRILGQLLLGRTAAKIIEKRAGGMKVAA